MKKTFKKIISCMLAVVMLMGMLPLATPAADIYGKPDASDMTDSLYLAIYKGQGFPGEPAVYSYTNYTNISSSFSTRFYGIFSSDASEQLSSDILNHLQQGNSSGSTRVWGVYDAQGMKSYFKPGASIIQPENEAKIIKAIKGNNVDPDDYEIIWYVIKYQTSDGWHIDGVIKEKSTYSVNYYGNGNTEGSAPTGEVGIPNGGSHTVLSGNGLRQVIDGLESEFLGWNTSPDGSGTLYKVGDKITNIQSNISLYAQWKGHDGYSATVKTYLDDILLDADEIHGENLTLLLGDETNTGNFIELERKNEGTYVAENLANGTYYVWHKDEDGTHHRVKTYQLIVQNDVSELHIYHYSVSYDTDGGDFKANEDPGTENYFKDTSVDATGSVPEKEGYIFLGWDYEGRTVDSSENITPAITEKTVLTAIWLKTVNVTVNAKIDHRFGGAYNEGATDDLTVYLTHLTDGSVDYVRQGSVIDFVGASTPGYTLNETKHENGDVLVSDYVANGPTFTGVPSNAEYSITTSKSGYEVTEVNIAKDNDGNWIIDVTLEYRPDSFDLEFSVKMFEEVPKELYPQAVNVKISYWSTVDNDWAYIYEHTGASSGVRVDIDKNTGMGYGTYPVFSHEDDEITPYGYRIEVVAFIYADGSVKHANESTARPNEAYSDGNYSAEIQAVTGGKLFGTLYGAYYDDQTSDQAGVLQALINLEAYDVTFDAQGGKVNGKDKDTVNDVYVVPSFGGYKPARDGYTFLGWYLDKDCTIPAVENAILVEDITLYAKWKAIQTITGNVIVSGSYILGNTVVDIWASDRPTKLTVLLFEVGAEDTGAVASREVNVIWNESTKLGTSQTYTFTDLDESKQYRIDILARNFVDTYQNETTKVTDDGNLANDYNENDYKAVFVSDRTKTFVNVYLTFEADVYEQEVKVDASEIGEGFRPDSTLVEIYYKLAGQDDSFYKVISQHKAPLKGLDIALGSDGKNTVVVTERVWKWNSDGTHYVYQAKLISSTFDGNEEVYTDNLPYTVTYGYAAQWNNETTSSTGPLYVYLTPNTYNVFYDVNTSDTVTGMESYISATGEYAEQYKWSYGIEKIEAEPKRAGYKFEGWYLADDPDVKVTSVDPSMHEDISLIAKWTEDDTVTKEVTYTVNHILVNGTQAVKDTKTYTDNVWVYAENNIVIKAGSLAHNSYEGYKFERIDHNVKEGDSVPSGTVINLYYVVDDADTVLLQYTVKHIVGGIVRDEKVVSEAVWSGETDKKITVTADSIALNTYAGYKYDSTLSTTVQAGDKVADDTVIEIVYVPDLTQTKTATYYVHHVVEGKVLREDTYTETVWVNAEGIKIQDATYTPHHFNGYVYDHADHVYSVGTVVPDGTIITLYYVKDTENTKTVSYSVYHNVDGVGMHHMTYTDKVWIGQNYITIKEGSLAPKNFVGYKFDSIVPNVKEGDSVENGSMIILNYVKDLSKTHTLEYKVEHVVDGEVRDTDTYSENVWIGSSALTVHKDTYIPNTYSGYVFDYADPVYEIGSDIEGGTVIRLYYEKEDSDVKHVQYFVDHNVGGKVLHRDIYTETVWVNENTLTVQPGTYEPREFTGYKFDHASPVFDLGGKVENGTVITLYYVMDAEALKELSYTVNHVVDGEIRDTVKYTEQVWVNNPNTLTVQEGTYDLNTYEGYVFVGADVKIPVGDPIEDGAVINLYYEKDEEAVKHLHYTVNHIVDGEIRDTVLHTEEKWINDDNFLTVHVGTYDPKVYPGYKFDYCDTDIPVGDKIENGAVINMYYTKDIVTYTVEYYFDGTKDDALTVVNRAELGAVITEYEDKVKEGYVLDKTEGLPLTVTADAEKNVIKVYYKTAEVDIPDNPDNPKTNDALVSALAAAILPAMGIIVLAAKSKKKRIAE